MTRFLHSAVVLLGVALGVEIWVGIRLASLPAPRPPTPLERFQANIQGNDHDCVPLGWYPERSANGAFYSSTNVNIANAGGAFQALWVGIVPPGFERDPRVQSVKEVMDRLVDARLLMRSDDPRGIRYNVTKYGQRFYYDGYNVNGNVEEWPYLCYSKLEVTNVSWDRRYADEPGPWHSLTKYVRVTWRTSTTAEWASPFLRAHSVQLAPTHNPSTAVVRRYVDGEWLLLTFLQEMPTTRWPIIPETAVQARIR